MPGILAELFVYDFSLNMWINPWTNENKAIYTIFYITFI